MDAGGGGEACLPDCPEPGGYRPRRVAEESLDLHACLCLLLLTIHRFPGSFGGEHPADRGGGAPGCAVHAQGGRWRQLRGAPRRLHVPAAQGIEVENLCGGAQRRRLRVIASPADDHQSDLPG